MAFALIVSLLVLTGCVTAKQTKLDLGLKPLNNEQLHELFSNTFSGSFVNDKNKMTTQVTYNKDGSQTLSNRKLSDTGNWRIAGDEYCSKWKIVRKGAEECSSWFKIADNQYEVYSTSGSFVGVLTVK